MFVRHKAILTVAILAVFMCVFFVHSSDAIEIISFPSNTEDTSYSDYTYHMAYVKTDVPIYHVSWFIDDTWVYGETLDSSTDYASYYPYDKIPGVIKGKKYEISVKVWEWDDDDGVFLSTTDSYTVRMFEPISLYKVGTNTGARGYAEISRFYYDGSHIIMSSYAYASNPSDNPDPINVLAWFRTQEYPATDGDAGEEHRKTHSVETVDVGKTSQYYYPGPDTDPEDWAGGGQPFDRDVGVLGDREVYYNAHAHLRVFTTKGLYKEDNWEVDTLHQTGTAAVAFSGKDGP